MRPDLGNCRFGGNYAVSFYPRQCMLVARFPRRQSLGHVGPRAVYIVFKGRPSWQSIFLKSSPIDGVKRLVAYRKVEGTP